MDGFAYGVRPTQATGAVSDDARPRFHHDALNQRPVVQARARLAQALSQRPARSAASGGLPPALQAGVEHLSGLSLGDVRVHYNSSRPATLQAHAYTQGTRIHIAPGQERHLPHEAWHVVQQKQGRVRPTLQAKGIPINDDSRLEREADVMGARAAGARVSARSEVSVSSPGPALVQRVVKVRREGRGKTLQGYPNTARYRDDLTDAQRSLRQDMHDDQRRSFLFDDVDALHAFLASDGTNHLPERRDVLRGSSEDSFDAKGEEAYAATGASRYLSETRADQNHWRRFLQLHRNNALSMLPRAGAGAASAAAAPAADGTDAAREAIGHAFEWGLVSAQCLDDHEQVQDLDLVPIISEGLAAAVDDTTELVEPLMVKQAVEDMYDAVQAVTRSARRPGPPIAVPHFGGTKNSMGLWAHISFRYGDSFPEGSSAAGSATTLPWEGPISHRRRPEGGHVYIRGHLLNDHLGGPVASYNLVPLVGVDVPGAPNSNAAHSSLVEGQARNTFKTMCKPPGDGSESPSAPLYTGIRYTVRVKSFGGFDVSAITRYFTHQYLWLVAQKIAVGTALHKSPDAVTIGEFKDHLGRNSADPAKLRNYSNEWTNRAKISIACVTDLGDETVTLASVINLMKRNNDLWRWEAKNLPTALIYSFDALGPDGQPIGATGGESEVPAGPVMNPMMRYRE